MLIGASVMTLSIRASHTSHHKPPRVAASAADKRRPACAQKYRICASGRTNMRRRRAESRPDSRATNMGSEVE